MNCNFVKTFRVAKPSKCLRIP